MASKVRLGSRSGTSCLFAGDGAVGQKDETGEKHRDFAKRV